MAATATGPRRAEALTRLATVVWAADGDRAGAEAFARALPAAAGDPAIEGDIHDNLAWLTCWLGDMPRAFDHVRIAREQAEQVGDPALLARVLAKYGQIEFQTGRSSGLDDTTRAIEFESTAGTVGEASADRTTLLLWSDRLDEARGEILGLLDRVAAEGNERLRPDLLARLGIIETRAGNWPLARAYLGEAIERATVAGLALGGLRRPLGNIDALDGSADQALALVEEMLPSAREQGAAWNVIRLLLIAGSTNLAHGDVQVAADQLDEADQICERIGVVEPGIFRVGADAVEALVGADRLDRAEAVLRRFERDSRAVGRPWAIAGSTRGRALVESAKGNQEAALAAANEAVRLGEVLDQPFELGRALLVAGTVERRAGRRREARTHLAGAVEIFERLGARPWTARAEAELGRISGRAPASNALTPTEERVTALVVDGLTNQEVAARLFVTVRTVETNLTRIYQKLEVRSRTELARRVASAREPAPETAAAGMP